MVVVCFIFPCFIHWTDCDTSSAPGCKCGIRNEERRLAKDAREDDNRVVGGEATGVNEYPWMALIVKQVSSTEMGMCGGALINSLWVVTALHCVVTTMNVTSVEELDPVSPESFLVILGDHDLTVNTETDLARGFLVEEVVIHPEGEDIALLKLQVAADLEVYSPVCLPEAGTDYRGRNVVVTGWGFDEATEGNDPDASTPDALQELELPILSRFACDLEMSLALGGKSDAALCFGGGNTGACFGDSGGPLVAEEEGKWVLAGTVSGGFGGTACATPGTIGLAVEVAAESVINFITSTSADGETCS